MRFLQKATVLVIATAFLPFLAQAAPITYQAILSGPAEAPPNNSPGTGSTRVTIDTDASTLTVGFEFADLIGTTIAAHIHAPTEIPFEGTASVLTMTPTFEDTPLGVTSGSYGPRTFDLTLAASYNQTRLAEENLTPEQAELLLANSLAEGRAYLNIHSTEFPGGEIRGFLTPIPLPAALPLLIAGLLALGWTAAPRRAA